MKIHTVRGVFHFKQLAVVQSIPVEFWRCYLNTVNVWNVATVWFVDNLTLQQYVNFFFLLTSKCSLSKHAYIIYYPNKFQI